MGHTQIKSSNSLTQKKWAGNKGKSLQTKIGKKGSKMKSGSKSCGKK